MSDPTMSNLVWKKGRFELGHNIYKFTNEFLAYNHSRHPAPNRQEVDLHWTWQVMKAYPSSNDPKRILLLDQVRHWPLSGMEIRRVAC